MNWQPLEFESFCSVTKAQVYRRNIIKTLCDRMYMLFITLGMYLGKAVKWSKKKNVYKNKQVHFIYFITKM